MEIQNQRAVLNNRWHVEIFVISENILFFLWNCLTHPVVFHAHNNNSVTVKFGTILMAKIVFYTYFDVCMQAS
jgi:hypothetical protein